MKKERPQTPLKNVPIGRVQHSKHKPLVTIRLQFLSTALMLFFFLSGTTMLQAQAPTSTCDDPIEVSSTNCGTGITPNIATGGWFNFPANGIVNVGVGLNGGAIFPIDFNCLMDDMDVIDDMDIRLNSSGFVAGPNSCFVYLQNFYDVRDSDGNIALNLVSIRAEYTGCSDSTPPVVTCAEFTASFDGCPDFYDPNTPNGVWTAIPASGTFQTTIGGGFISTIDLNGCVTDNLNTIGQLERTLLASYEENNIPGCSVDIINEFQIRDACGNVSPTTIIYRGTISFSGPPPVITCPANITVECGDPIDPMSTGMATATSGCGTPVITFVDGPIDASCGGATGIFQRTFTATDGCGQTSTCAQIVTIVDSAPPVVSCTDISVELVNGTYTLTQADEDAIGAGTADDCSGLDATLTGILPTTFGVGDVGDNLVTYNATDNCGNTTACVATVTVVCPLVVDCSNITDQDLECRSDLPSVDFDLPIIVESCGDPILSALTIIPGNDGCPGNPVIIPRTYFIQDQAGNMEQCMQTFTVESTIPPTVTCPADVVLQCDDDTSPANTGMATGTASCSNFNVTITFDDVSTQGMAGCAQYQYTIERTWSATDNCGRVTTCLQTIEVIDDTDPVITCPADLTIQCDEDTSPANTGEATATDNCSVGADLVVTFADVSTQGMAGCAQYQYTITRTWTATDACGNVDVCTQIIEVIDDTAPVITCAADVIIECDEDTSPANTGESTATDNCSVGDDLVVSFTDVSTQGMACGEFSYIIIRTWTATDACGNAATCSQTITVQDNNPPTITCPADVTVECDQPTDPGATGNATATADNCAADDQLTVTFLDVSTQVPTGCGNDSYTITRTWTASDPCGNTAQCVQVITVEDTTPPTIVCPPNVTIECDEDTAPANTGEAVAIDDCAPAAEIVITFADASTQTTSGCGQYQYVITRTWTATDPCGNATNCVQTINVEDTTAPEIVCPATVNISCTDSTDPADNGMATGTDNCSAVAEIGITSTDVSTQTNEGCGQFTYSIARTWMATDACGNTTTCVQTINVSDTEAPVITCPPSQTLSCFETVPAPITNAADYIAAGGTISDNCTSALTDFTVFAINDDNGGDNCPGNARTVVRTYYVLDACGNTATCEQTFTYLESTQGPVITSVLPSCFKFCASLNNPMESDITFTTDCSFDATVNIAGPQQIGADNCPGTIYRYTYTVTDDCGRTSAPVTRDFIIGNDGPTITCTPFNLILECGDPLNQEYIDTHLGLVDVNTSCELGYTLNYFPQNFNLISCASSTVVTFVATDACGRTASCTTTISILDTTAPTFTEVPPSVCDEIDCSGDINFWYNHWIDYMEEGLQAEDACDTNVSIQAINTPVNTDCPNGDAVTVVTFVATDNCGNESEITGTFTVLATPSSLTAMGIIATEEAETVESVSVTLSGNNGFTDLYETAEDGQYNFEGLVLDNNYTITPMLDQNPLNGVSSYDLVLINKHILQTESLDSPYKMIAADVNRSGSITTLDILELRKMILFIEDDFANNTSWRFVDADFVFPQPNNPFATVFPEEVFINGLTESVQHDFVGVKIGDVNGTAVANDLIGSEDRTFNGDLNFNIQDQRLETGESYAVDFRASDFTKVLGYQYSLQFDENKVEFESVSAGDLAQLTEANFGLSKLEEGVITTSWINESPVTLMDDAVLFTIRFKAKSNSTLSEVISIGSSYTAAEAYREVSAEGSVALQDVQLRFDTEAFGGARFALHQNIPNPFADETMIGFNLPDNSNVTITIYDMSGRALKQIEGEYTKGYHSVSVTRDELQGSTGILYYELATPKQRITKKMTLIRK